MTKAIAAGMVTHLAGDTTTLASCIELTREDGTVFRFTDHPTDIVFGGNTYLASVGHEASDPVTRNNLSVDGLELRMILDNPGITEADLLQGLWDYANYKLFWVNYVLPDTDSDVKLQRGRLGEVNTSRGVTATVELRSLTQHLQKEIGEKYSPDCPVELDDPRCGIQVKPTTWAADIAAAVGDQVSPSTENDRQFVTTRAGHTGSAEPTWNTAVGATTEAIDTGTTSDIADGTTTGGDSATVLIDSTATFQAHDVTVGDVIRNVTDGSAGTVVSIQSEIQLTTDALTGGADQTWQTGDTYSIDLAVALNDSTATWQTDNIVTGSVVRNTTDGSAGTVISIVSEILILTSAMTGGTINAWAVGDTYEIEGAEWTTRDAFTKIGTVNTVTDSQTFQADGLGLVARGTATALVNGTTTGVLTGTTTGADDPTTLIDSAAAFQTDGVQASDPIRNTTDGSAGTVSSVDSEIQITTSALTGGGENDWDTGDTYEIDTETILIDSTATFLTNNLQVGDAVRNTTDGSNATIVGVNSETELETTALDSGSDNNWESGDAYEIDTGTVLIDGSATFIADGIKAGDTISNDTDGSTASVISVTSETQLATQVLTGGTADLYAVSDAYSIQESSQRGSGTHTGAADEATELTDSEATFVLDGILPGDFVSNTTDGSSANVVTVDSETEMTLTALVGGTDNDWDLDDAYTIDRENSGADAWQYGVVTWLTGSNTGLQMEVGENTIDGTITLFLPMGSTITAGDTFEIETGCDKLFTTCRNKFNNVINFQGFPTVPVSDILFEIGGQQ